jgi:hypothetical protein
VRWVNADVRGHGVGWGVLHGQGDDQIRLAGIVPLQTQERLMQRVQAE